MELQKEKQQYNRCYLQEVKKNVNWKKKKLIIKKNNIVGGIGALLIGFLNDKTKLVVRKDLIFFVFVIFSSIFIGIIYLFELSKNFSGVGYPILLSLVGFFLLVIFSCFFIFIFIFIFNILKRVVLLCPQV